MHSGTAIGQRVEHATRGRVQGAGNVTLEHDPFPLSLHYRVGDRCRGKQRLGVGVQRVLVELSPFGNLHDLTEVHHDHAVTDVPHDGKVVRDEQVCDPELGLQVLQEVDDLGLDRDVQGGHGLVQDDQSRFRGKCARNAEALSLATAEFVRVTFRHGGVEADGLEQLHYLGPVVRLALVQPVDLERCADDITGGGTRVQRAVRVLEYHPDVPPHPSQAGAAELDQVLTFEQDLSAGRLGQLQHRAAGRGLARAALAHEAQGLARTDREADPVDGLDGPDTSLQDQAAGHREMHLEVPDFDQRRRSGSVRRGRRCRCWRVHSSVPEDQLALAGRGQELIPVVRLDRSDRGIGAAGGKSQEFRLADIDKLALQGPGAGGE